MLVGTGAMYSNPSAKWAIPPLIFLTPGKTRFRFTVVLHNMNRFRTVFNCIMSNINDALTRVFRSKYFFIIEFSNSYRQLPLHVGSRKYQSSLILNEVYEPTLVLHETVSAIIHLQLSLMWHLQNDLLTSHNGSVIFWLQFEKIPVLLDKELEVFRL